MAISIRQTEHSPLFENGGPGPPVPKSRTTQHSYGHLWYSAGFERHQFNRNGHGFFPDGIAFDGNSFVRTGARAPAFSYLREIRTENKGLVAQIFTSWNPLIGWLARIEALRSAA